LGSEKSSSRHGTTVYLLRVQLLLAPKVVKSTALNRLLIILYRDAPQETV
jgi:hypothetical protein